VASFGRIWQTADRRIASPALKGRCMKKAFFPTGFVALLILGCLVSRETLCLAQADAWTGPETQRRMTALREAVDEKKPHLVDARRRGLTQMGAPAVPHIAAELRNTRGPEAYQLELVYALGATYAKGASEALISVAIATSNPQVAASIPKWIDRQPIEFPLSESEIAALMRWIDHPDVRTAGDWSYILVRARHVDQTRLVEPVLGRFKQAVAQVASRPEPRHGWMGDEAFLLARFLTAFQEFERELAVRALRREIKRSTDAHERMWMVIAAGRNGDIGAEDELHTLLKDESLPHSTRAVALQSYARLIGPRAIPVLSEFDDAYPRRFSPHEPVSPGDVAREELRRLQ
jgi:hypothetical protein